MRGHDQVGTQKRIHRGRGDLDPRQGAASKFQADGLTGAAPQG